MSVCACACACACVCVCVLYVGVATAYMPLNVALFYITVSPMA